MTGVVTTPDAPLPDWATRLVAELDASRRRAEQLVQGLSNEQLNWHPALGAWSVGQCIEHLAITNDVYLPPRSEHAGGPPDSARPLVRSSAEAEATGHGWRA